MDPARLRLCRSALFLPASNPRAVDKARTLDADLIILDCEDAVKEQYKVAARAAAAAAVAAGFDRKLCAVRINGIGSPWHDADRSALAGSEADLIVLPKAESAAAVSEVREATGKPVIAMIESAAGLIAAAEVGGPATALMAGTNDLSADLGLPAAGGRAGQVTALQTIVIAARARGIAVFDGVFNGLDDPEGLEEECRQGAAFGFDGKSVIHPNQIAVVNRCFSPDQASVTAAERLIAAAQGGAERFEGRMIEDMHVAQARAVLAKARR